jgi:hypothetical protein
MRWWPHLLAAASILGAAVPATVASTLAALPGVSAAAAPLAGCTTTTGVIVAVDLSPWAGQSIDRGCAATVTPATTGYQALTQAGFSTAGDNQDGPAFVCRIDGYPTEAQDPCITTPPASAYWSYWYAPAGQDTWSYSQFGAMSFHPTAGSVNAWSFGAGTPPPFAPRAVWATTVGPPGGGSTTTTTAPPTAPAASAPSTTTTTAPGLQPTHRTGTAAPSAGTRQSTVPTVAASPTGGPHPSTTTSTTGPPEPTTARAGTTTRPRTGARIVDVAPVSAEHAPSAGSPLPLVVGAVVAAALLGSGGFIAWRRRRAG